MYTQVVTVLLVTICSVSCTGDEAEEYAADPRLFFGNVTASKCSVLEEYIP